MAHFLPERISQDEVAMCSCLKILLAENDHQTENAGTVVYEISVKIAWPQQNASPPPSKQYTPYSPTNIALYFINRGPFYGSILGL